MCGIFGAIGRSKDPKVTYDLLNSLFIKTEVRGTDATGFYACYPGESAIIYDKEPLKSTEYVKQRDIWSKAFKAESNVDSFIGHCRQTSVGGGTEKVNKNNHPHLSEDRRVAMVHNGKIPEFSALKGKYDVGSECDSEILLRMFESAQVIAKDREKELKEEFPSLTPFLAERLLGLKEIFSRVNYGAMAVAIAERGDDGSRYLWLFRDDERPLHVVDMRPTLGQIFFCSTAEIWRNAIEATPSMKQFVPQDQVIIEFPAFQIWLLGLDPSKMVNGEQPEECWNIRKFKITKTKYIDWQEKDDEDDKLSFKKPKDTVNKPPMKVVSRLGENEEVPKDEQPPALPGKESKKKDGDKRGNNSQEAFNQPGHGNPGGLESGGTRLNKSKVTAKVVLDGRDPGDETEYNDDEGTWPGMHGPPVPGSDIPEGLAEELIQNPQPVDPEEIDLDLFDQLAEQIEQDLAKLKEAIHAKVKDKAVTPKDFSQILDSMHLTRSEFAQALQNLK